MKSTSRYVGPHNPLLLQSHSMTSSAHQTPRTCHHLAACAQETLAMMDTEGSDTHEKFNDDTLKTRTRNTPLKQSASPLRSARGLRYALSKDPWCPNNFARHFLQSPPEQAHDGGEAVRPAGKTLLAATAANKLTVRGSAIMSCTPKSMCAARPRAHFAHVLPIKWSYRLQTRHACCGVVCARSMFGGYQRYKELRTHERSGSTSILRREATLHAQKNKSSGTEPWTRRSNGVHARAEEESVEPAKGDEPFRTLGRPSKPASPDKQKGIVRSELTKHCTQARSTPQASKERHSQHVHARSCWRNGLEEGWRRICCLRLRKLLLRLRGWRKHQCVNCPLARTAPSRRLTATPDAVKASCTITAGPNPSLIGDISRRRADGAAPLAP